MVLHAGADIRVVVQHRQAQRLEQTSRPDARKLEKLRRIDGAARHDDLAARAVSVWPCRTYATPTARRPSKSMCVTWARVSTFRLARFIAGLRKARAAESRMPPLVVVLIETDAFLLRAIEVGRVLQTCGLCGSEERITQRVRLRAEIGDVDGPSPPAQSRGRRQDSPPS